MTMTSPRRRYVTRSKPRPRIETRLSRTQTVRQQPWSTEKVRNRSVVRTSPPTHRLYQEGATLLAKETSDLRGQRRLTMPPVTDDGTFIEFHNVVAAQRQLLSKPLSSRSNQATAKRRDVVVVTLPSSIDPEFEPITIPITPSTEKSGRTPSKERTLSDRTRSVNTTVRQLASTTRPVQIELPLIARQTKSQVTSGDETEAVLVVNPRPSTNALSDHKRRDTHTPLGEEATFGHWEWAAESSDSKLPIHR